ncbi:hypothetical protein TIFTF001_014248 [Ficus carica]|uniref:Retrotransposon gag domain-containing protein n=1 Tax=Ficus carica TaxID=3494 RepID=A0AA88A2E0_FICCA|nr:hypothetical protein TIFTF001_014248 [Ficus carica]
MVTAYVRWVVTNSFYPSHFDWSLDPCLVDLHGPSKYSATTAILLSSSDRSIQPTASHLRCVTSFKELIKTFLENYSINIYIGTTHEELLSIVQEPGESLRSFVKRFSKDVVEIPNCNDIVDLLAFKRGLTPNLSFLNEICNRKSRTIAEALALAQGLIDCEYFSKTPHAEGHSLDQCGRDNVRWLGKIMNSPNRKTMDQFCKFHKKHGHQTVDYKALRYEIVELLKRGHLKEFLSEKGRQHMESPKIGLNQRLGFISQKHIKKVSIPPPDYLPSDSLIDHIISFHKKEATKLCRSHDDALVIMLPIANRQVRRILVDNGSSTDILFLTALKEMDMSE